MMQQLRAWLLSLGIALFLVIVVRSFAFAIYRVPAASVLRQGDRVMVNMFRTHQSLARRHFDDCSKALRYPHGVLRQMPL